MITVLWDNSSIFRRECIKIKKESQEEIYGFRHYGFFTYNACRA